VEEALNQVYQDQQRQVSQLVAVVQVVADKKVLFLLFITD